MKKPRRNSRSQSRRPAAQSAPPEPQDQTKVSPTFSSARAAKSADSAPPTVAVPQIIRRAGEVPRVASDDDGEDDAHGKTRIEAPSVGLRARARPGGSAPPNRIVRDERGVARFVDEDADEASALEKTRAGAPPASLIEKMKKDSHG